MKTATARAEGPAAAAADAAPLRVLVINSVLTGGGVDSHTLSLCRALVGRGMDVSLAMPKTSRWLEHARAIAGLRVIALGAQRPWWPIVLAARLRRERVQIVHAHHGRDYWLAIACAWLSGKGARAVVTRHLMNPLKDKTRRYLAAWTTVVAVSDAVARSLAQCDPHHTLRVRRIHCGIDTAVFRPDEAVRDQQRARLGVAPSAPVFAVVGAIHAPEGKGQLHFAAAAARVLAAHPDACFFCLGSGELVPALEAEAARLGLGPHFRVEPFSDDVAGWLQAIDVLVHPAVGSEALGLVILEALACGKAVIASRLDGISETFQDGVHGRLVPPRDVSALADAMDNMAGNPAARQAMGQAGRAWVEAHFSLPRLGEQTEQLYRDCLTESP